MKLSVKNLILIPVLLSLAGCEESGDEFQVVRTPERLKEKPAKKEPCPNGDTDPFDKCGKNPWKPQPLEAFPRKIPDIKRKTRFTDLSTNADFVDKLAGEWIGTHFEPGGHDKVRIHLRFGTDNTFQASVLDNTAFQFGVKAQWFRMISGSFSKQDGMLALQLSEEENSFLESCHGSSWRIATKLQLIIPIGFDEEGKTLTLHTNETNHFVVNVFVKKED